jgi:hypothetical protein
MVIHHWRVKKIFLSTQQILAITKLGGSEQYEVEDKDETNDSRTSYYKHLPSTQ